MVVIVNLGGFVTEGSHVYKLAFFVPPDYLEKVKQAVFSTGAGRIGDYEQCCWEVLGSGQFKPLPGSAPFVGELNELTAVAEYRVELVCTDELIAEAVRALVASHPYEEPAYDVWKLEELAL